MGILQPIITIVLFFLILGTLVVIHELGHFVAARVAGVRVLEFGIGFPPRAKVLRSKGETLYTLNWLPIGGFVKLEGEDGDNHNDPRAFSSKSLPVRLGILVSGVVMNVLLAFVIFTGIVWLASPQVGAKFAEVQQGSPAASAGLQAGETIVAVNGERFQVFIQPSLVEVLRANAGQSVTLTVLDANGATREVTTTLRDPSQIDKDHGALGIADIEPAYDGSTTTNDLGTAIKVGWEQTVQAMGLIIGALGSLVGGIVTNPTAAPVASGPIGIAATIGDYFFRAGPIFTLYIAGILSANLAVVNILPFPPLDGGRMLMITLKRIFGSRISLRAEQTTYLVGFVFLFTFLIWVSGFDVIRLLNGGTLPQP
ncbi:MAG TPA: M50 family metallopeptidase [Candidatus Limnocylindrales bacterium]|nr:M50 family metallopeptidase [Candidatus Limnocylindrales bacterium]